MAKGRLEAFSDGVFAIIITIMVLELKVPHQGDLAALWAKTTLRPWRSRFTAWCSSWPAPLAFVNQWIALALYAAAALMWLVPDRRFEKPSAVP